VSGVAPPLERDVWAELVAGGTVTELRPRTAIFHSGSHTLVAAVLRGLVRVFLWVGSHRQVTIEYVPAGQIVGLTRVLSGRDEIRAEAVTASTVAMLSMEQVRAILEERPTAAWTVVEREANRVVDGMCAIVDSVAGPVRSRVARHLLDLAVVCPGGETVAPVTHRCLAEAVGTAREVATRALRELVELGLVATATNRVVLLDPDGLATVVAAARCTAHVAVRTPRRSPAAERADGRLDGRVSGDRHPATGHRHGRRPGHRHSAPAAPGRPVPSRPPSRPGDDRADDRAHPPATAAGADRPRPAAVDPLAASPVRPRRSAPLQTRRQQR
jgi:CRP/FNR family transcriptional regulator, cyclic AMP receptor protein